jgi:anti-sigma B factor antagonist
MQEALTVEPLAGRSAGTRILHLAGPLVLETLSPLKSELERDNPPVTILELSGVPYMDSAGMGVILKYYVSAQRRGHRVIAAGMNIRLIELFKLTHVDTLIPIVATAEEAERL